MTLFTLASWGEDGGGGGGGATDQRSWSSPALRTWTTWFASTQPNTTRAPANAGPANPTSPPPGTLATSVAAAEACAGAASTANTANVTSRSLTEQAYAATDLI